MLSELNDVDEIIRTMIVPAASVMSKSQISVGIANSKYFKYTNRYDYIEKLARFHSEELINTR